MKLKHKKILLTLSVLAGLYFFLFLLSLFIIPKGGPYSYALYDKNKTLLAAQVAGDEQWRFEKSKVPKKFEKCIIQFEDKRFYSHLGIDLISISRAAVYNFKSKRIVSGGSTLTMQTIRLLEKNPKRTYLQKIKEAFLSVLLEIRYSKKTILELYSANAPFGGNVVGLEAASWRYFYRPSESLTWAESATLAVLPNQPSLVYPGVNSAILLEKRNDLLYKLFQKKIIDLETYELSRQEVLPSKPYDLPQFSYHYLEYLKSKHKKQTQFYTTLDASLQKNTVRIIENWSNTFSHKGIENACAIIIDTKTQNVLAYCANTSMGKRNKKNGAVDLIQAKRSSGSLLKPFLFAAMLDSGKLMYEQLVIDVPTRIGNYKPDNNVLKYEGAVKANEALSRSLNIPAVRELREYGINSFLDILHKAGFTTFTRTSDDYGLPLILGGGEIKLFEAVKAYANMMNQAQKLPSNNFPCSTGASYLTLMALSEGTRPEEEASWKNYANSKCIAWKTGTSSGNRDAWAIGTTAEYTVGVWIGNADGEGRADLKSAQTSAPVLFDLFSILPNTSWPYLPVLDLKVQKTCSHSGYPAGLYCDELSEVYAPVNSHFQKICPYCNTFTLTFDSKFQVSVEDLQKDEAGIYKDTLPVIKNYFALPPNIEYWYKKVNINYKTLPPYIDCHNSTSQDELSIVFPEEGANLIIPIEIDGSSGFMVMQCATHSVNSILYWDLDGEYIGSTESVHELKVNPKIGKHVLTVTDSFGNRKKRFFEVVKSAD